MYEYEDEKKFRLGEFLIHLGVAFLIVCLVIIIGISFLYLL